MQRGIDEPGAVVVRDDFDALRQNVLVQFLDLCFDARQTSEGFSPLRIRMMPLTISSFIRPDHALALRIAAFTAARSLTRSGVPLTLADDDVADVVGRAQQADAADENCWSPCSM